MGNHSNGKPFLIFAGWTLFAVLAIGAIIIPLRLRDLRSQAEGEAAAVAKGTVAPALEEAAGELSERDLASFERAAEGLIGGGLIEVRLYRASGELLASAGDAAPEEPDLGAIAGAAEGETSTSKAGSPQGAVLVSYAPLGSSAVLELRQDYAPISAAFRAQRQDLLISLIGGGLALVLILPLGLWVLLRGLRTEYSRLLYLYRSGQGMRSTLEVAAVLESLARDAAIYTESNLGIATLLEESTNDLIVNSSYDRKSDTSAQHHRQVEHWFLRRCAATAATVATDEPTFPYKELLGYEPQAPAAVIAQSFPIRGPDRAIGVLTLTRDKSVGPFHASQLQVVEEMAAQAALAVGQALLFSKMRSYATEVEVSYDTTLRVLMGALDTKDKTTQGHSARVSRLTLSLAREMSIPNDQLVHLERGALLHDVGKIGVPDAILNKPDSLNEAEWEAMRKHPMLAGLMISQVGFLEGALPILLYHHERYDGGGYPFSLAGEAIPLEARIFAVVDSYDAMTSDRPYRDAMSSEAALHEIRSHAGTQFDPQVVDAFERVIERERPAQQRAS